jgi:predicted MPP superfamily phosphohydrolase
MVPQVALRAAIRRVILLLTAGLKQGMHLGCTEDPPGRMVDLRLEYNTLNWSWLIVRVVVGLTMLTLIVLSQRFWYRAIWRSTARWGAVWLRIAARAAYMVLVAMVVLALADGLRMGRHGHLVPKVAMATIVAGLWFTSALFSYLAVEAVRGIDRVWRWLRPALAGNGDRVVTQPRTNGAGGQATADVASQGVERLADPSRRYFFRTASVLAGAAPFVSAVYGFAAERVNYKVMRVEIPMANLPSAMDGMTVVQLSDIHLSGYTTREEVRRAVDMANGLGADLAVVTGDFITTSSDPLVDCIEEVSRLHAPMGVWGCNGNHEIYAKAEEEAQQLFAQHGMKLLRQESAVLSYRGAQFNLMGVDYQRERTPSGQKTPMLSSLGGLIRRDMPNILMSHNPNSFNRAAEMGIELSLAGHTHGGQIQVEILDHRLTPARFISDYTAGLYGRPLLAAAHADKAAPAYAGSGGVSQLYVNRGIGTVGAPVRLGVPPEITLVVLRRA